MMMSHVGTTFYCDLHCDVICCFYGSFFPSRSLVWHKQQCCYKLGSFIMYIQPGAVKKERASLRTNHESRSWICMTCFLIKIKNILQSRWCFLSSLNKSNSLFMVYVRTSKAALVFIIRMSSIMSRDTHPQLEGFHLSSFCCFNYSHVLLLSLPFARLLGWVTFCCSWHFNFCQPPSQKPSPRNQLFIRSLDIDFQPR